MKIIFLVSLVVLITGCSGKITANIPVPAKVQKEEALKIDVFSLTFHKQMGSCTSLPITHRVLHFSYIPLTPNGSDMYAGSLEVLLDDQTQTYEAIYREFPGIENVDQTQFQTTLSGRFEIIKAVSDSTNDKMILEDIGVVLPAIKGNKINFFLKLDADINKVVTQNEVLGSVMFKGTALVTDNCLL